MTLSKLAAHPSFEVERAMKSNSNLHHSVISFTKALRSYWLLRVTQKFI